MFIEIGIEVQLNGPDVVSSSISMSIVIVIVLWTALCGHGSDQMLNEVGSSSGNGLVTKGTVCGEEEA